MDTKEKNIMVIQIILLYIILPTADVFTDLLLICKLFMGSFIGEAIALFIPFSLNYIFTLACWILSEEKTRTLIFPLLIIYPQFCKFIQTFFQRSCFNLITIILERICRFLKSLVHLLFSQTSKEGVFRQPLI